MTLDRITWDDEGWPTVACDGRPSTRSPTPWSDEAVRSSPDPAAGSDRFRVDSILGDVEEHLGQSEDDYYGRQNRLIQDLTSKVTRWSNAIRGYSRSPGGHVERSTTSSRSKSETTYR